MVEEMICTISSNKQRLEVWKWVFEKERGIFINDIINIKIY